MPYLQRLLFFFSILAMLLALSLIVVPPVRAATIDVTSLANTGAGTLRAAIDAAQPMTANGADIINITVSGTIPLTAMLPVITTEITINNTSGGTVTISRSSGNYSLIRVNSGGNLTLNGLTLSGGRGTNVSGDRVGGAVYVPSGTLTVMNSTFSSNRAYLGSAIYSSSGTVTLTNTTFSNNAVTTDTTGEGGAIYTNNSTLTLTNTTFSRNYAYYGGAIYARRSTLNVTNSTFSENEAGDYAGAIYNEDSTLTITSSTFTNNIAATYGGALRLDQNIQSSNTTITNSTFSGNTGSWGGAIQGWGTTTVMHSTFVDYVSNQVFSVYDSFSMGHSVVASNNAIYPDSDQFTSLGYNLFEDADAENEFANAEASDSFGVDPELGALASNGGPTQTHRPETGSPLIDAGDPAIATPPTYDQRGRGFNRVQGVIDIGAFEVQTSEVTVDAVSSTDANGTYGIGDVVTLTVQYSGSVVVTGTPQLALNSAASAIATYNGTGSGSDTLEFTYTVSAGDSSADLDYASTSALTLNGGTIVGADGAATTVTLPTPGAAGSLGANKNLVIDGDAPTVNSVTRVGTTPTNATEVDFTVTFSEAVTGVGTADFDLDGIADASITGMDGSGNTYTVTVSTGSSDGTLRLDVLDDDTIVDVASNPLASAFTTGEAYTIDKTPPATTITAGPEGATSDSTPDFSFSSESGATFECVILAGSTAPVVLDWLPCTTDSGGLGTYAPATLNDGAYTFWVRATDPVGNTEPAPALRAFTVDTVAPETTITAGPEGATNDTAPEFSFSSEADTTFECVILAGSTAPVALDWLNCTTDASGVGSYTPTTLSEGAYTFWVRATDEVGNTESTPASRAFIVDTTPPDTTITAGPDSATNDTTPTFGFSSEADATFECVILSSTTAPVDSEWLDCVADSTSAGSYTPSALNEGGYIFWVRATDAAGNTDTSSASRAFSVDLTEPETTITAGPDAATNDATPTFSYSSEADTTFECALLSGSDAPIDTDWADCTVDTTGVGSDTASTLAEGSYTFWVRATDVGGNTDTSPASRAFSVDVTAPDTTITTGPDGATSDATPTFGYSSEADTTFACVILAGSTAPDVGTSWLECTADTSGVSSYTPSTLSDGAYTFWVRATDDAGNTDATPASRAFSVDTTAPDTTVTDGPNGATSDNTPTFAFSSEADTTFECVILAGSSTPDGTTTWLNCTIDTTGVGSYTPSVLNDGTYTFWVRATDAVGNVETSPASRAFSVDATAPDTTITAGPDGPTNDATPTFGYISEANTTFECVVLVGSTAPDGGTTWVDCTTDTSGVGSYTPATLGDGAYTFWVRATDANQNADASPASRAFSVDSAPLTVTVSTASGQSDPALTAPIAFTVVFNKAVEDFVEADVLLGGTASATDVTITPVSETEYTVSVGGMTSTGTVTVSVPAETVTDAAGNTNTGSNEVTVTFAPVVPLVTGITRLDANPTNDDEVRFGVTFSEVVTGVDADDFALEVNGLTGVSIEDLSGSGQAYVVTVSTGTGDVGTIALNLVDDDSIVDANDNPLGGWGTGNGDFDGPTYTIERRDEDDEDDANEDGGPGASSTASSSPSLQNFLCDNLAVQTSFALTGQGSIGNLQANGLFGDTYCHVINLDGMYITSAAEVGNLDMINLGIVQAVDVYGLLPGGIPITQFSSPAQICLRGTGSVYFISAVDNSVQQLAPVQNGGYLCVDLWTAGKLVLAGGSPNFSASPLAGQSQTGPTNNREATPVSDCRVTTTHAVRLRSTPDTGNDSNIMGALPYEITLQATAYVDGWYRVIYLDGQGWVSEQYLTTDGAGCVSST